MNLKQGDVIKVNLEEVSYIRKIHSVSDWDVRYVSGGFDNLKYKSFDIISKNNDHESLIIKENDIYVCRKDNLRDVRIDHVNRSFIFFTDLGTGKKFSYLDLVFFSNFMLSEHSVSIGEVYEEISTGIRTLVDTEEKKLKSFPACEYKRCPETTILKGNETMNRNIREVSLIEDNVKLRELEDLFIIPKLHEEMGHNIYMINEVMSDTEYVRDNILPDLTKFKNTIGLHIPYFNTLHINVNLDSLLVSENFYPHLSYVENLYITSIMEESIGHEWFDNESFLIHEDYIDIVMKYMLDNHPGDNLNFFAYKSPTILPKNKNERKKFIIDEIGNLSNYEYEDVEKLYNILYGKNAYDKDVKVSNAIRDKDINALKKSSVLKTITIPKNISKIFPDDLVKIAKPDLSVTQVNDIVHAKNVMIDFQTTDNFFLLPEKHDDHKVLIVDQEAFIIKRT